MNLKFEQQGGSDREIKGYTYMARGGSAGKYQPATRLSGVGLPNKVDLRAFMTEVEDQKQANSCTANAVAGAYEYLIKKYLSKKAFDVSRLFIYYNARLRASPQIKDAGSYIQYAVDSLMKIGACKEPTWPYDLKQVNTKPHEDSYVSASDFKIEKKKFIPVNLEAWKSSLAEGYPIVFGIALFPTFDSCTKNKGIVPMPNPTETGRTAHGLHAMLCVGYSDIDKMFIVRNSWGSKWGDKGYCYMPYEYIINTKFNMGDNWIFGRSTPIPDSEETWIEDKKSIIDNGRGYNRSDFKFYKEEQYKKFDALAGYEVYEYDEEEPEEYYELEFEGEGEYDEILAEYEDEVGEEEYDEEVDFEDEEYYDEEEEFDEEESDEEEEEESDEEEEEEESDEEEEEEVEEEESDEVESDEEEEESEAEESGEEEEEEK